MVLTQGAEEGAGNHAGELQVIILLQVWPVVQDIVDSLHQTST